MIKTAVLGYGTVGSGVVEVLEKNREIIAKRAGNEIEVKYVLDRKDFSGTPIENKIVSDFEQIIQDEEIKVVVEVLGGIEPAYTFVKRSLEAGKSVVTSNKELVAQCGAELLALAEKKQVNFLYEASVGGGIPIIRSLHQALTGDEIEEIIGILNGTTNYMMTKMFNEGVEYDEVLKEAQDKGYAERNPEADVEGHDACRKIAILSSVISGKCVDYKEIYTEGITKITATDMKYAKKLGKTIKLLASAKREGDKISAMVSPCLLNDSHPLYHVDGVFNAVFVKGNMLGDAMFYGSGAGKLPTASAVVGDVVDAVKNMGRVVMPVWTEEKVTLTDKADTEKKFFVRMKGVPEEYTEKIEAVFEKTEQVVLEDISGEFGFMTEKMKESVYEEKAAQFSNILHMMRVEE
ncbi:MAG: homoserine dehydrogenase [Lachnospiraceae bacterium]|nr:homoserine dehydrogenase [Lachnospiraceae bacterium]